MKNKGILTAVLIVMMCIALFPMLSVASPTGGVAFIQVSATSPHVANGTDFSKVTIYAADVNGTPVAGAEIVVFKFMGLDDKESFLTTDHGNGTYTADVNSTLDGKATLYAEDLATGTEANCTIYFEPGPLTIIDLWASNPRETEPKNASDVAGMALDAFNNVIMSPRVEVNITSDLGAVSHVYFDEIGVFHTTLVYSDLGVANVTATAYDSSYGIETTKTTSVMFPAIYFHTLRDAYTINSNFTMYVNIHVSDPGRALGYYDLMFTYNSSVIRFVDASDGNPYDEFDVPVATVGPGGSAVRIFQRNYASMISPTGSVDVANLTFTVVGGGYTLISKALWCGLETSLTDTDGVPLPHYPEPLPLNKTGKKPPTHEVCLFVNIVNNCVDKNRVNRDITYLKKVFEKNCVPINITLCKPYPNYIEVNFDKDNNSKLDEYKNANSPTKEEWRLLGGYKDDNNKTKRKDGCINVFYVKELEGSQGESLTLRDWPNFDGNPKTKLPKGPCGNLTDCKKDEGPNMVSAVVGKKVGGFETAPGTLAHEIGHMLIDSDHDHYVCCAGYKVWSPKNTMYPGSIAEPNIDVKKCGYQLDKECQIKRMKKSPFLKKIEATDNKGIERKRSSKCYDLNIDESVYLIGSGFTPSTTMDIYLIPDGANFSSGNEVAMVSTTTDENGTIPVTYVWTTDHYGDFDIWIDYNRDGIADPGEYISHEEHGLSLIRVPKPPLTGDVNDDSIVNIKDIVICALAFGSYWHTPIDPPGYNYLADLNNDGQINIFDLVAIAVNFGKTV